MDYGGSWVDDLFASRGRGQVAGAGPAPGLVGLRNINHGCVHHLAPCTECPGYHGGAPYCGAILLARARMEVGSWAVWVLALSLAAWILSWGVTLSVKEWT